MAGLHRPAGWPFCGGHIDNIQVKAIAVNSGIYLITLHLATEAACVVANYHYLLLYTSHRIAYDFCTSHTSTRRSQSIRKMQNQSKSLVRHESAPVGQAGSAGFKPACINVSEIESEQFAWLMEHDPDALLLALDAQLQDQIDAVGDVSAGAVLRHEARAMWAFVLPDLRPGTWRVQLFDEQGFIGHLQHGDAAEAVRYAVLSGYRARDDGALDRVASLESFQRGNFITGLVEQVNCGLLTMDEYKARISAYDHAPDICAA